LTGADLFPALWPRLAAEERPVVVLAANEEIAAALRAGHPRARCIVAPRFDVGDAATIVAVASQVRDAVEAAGAEFVLLCISMPKHHRVCAALTETDAPTTSPWVLLLGAAAEFHLGMRRRAPRWMQRAGLEWLHRLGRDPRGMARRYLVDDVAFLPLVWRELRDTRWRRTAAPSA
jgi:N-acetylglucosaminyldiphosphoundecaprenol N-acetyl-beta-D-mannosaminyltransferase